MIAVARSNARPATAQETPQEPFTGARTAPDAASAALAPTPHPLPPETLDRRRNYHREHAELIVARAAFLPPQDRALVESVYDEGISVTRLAGLRNECPRTLRRRLRRLIARVLSPRYAFVVASRDGWPPARRKIASAVVVQGQSMRRTAHALKYTFHTVRKEMQSVDALFEATLALGRERA